MHRVIHVVCKLFAFCTHSDDNHRGARDYIQYLSLSGAGFSKSVEPRVYYLLYQLGTGGGTQKAKPEERLRRKLYLNQYTQFSVLAAPSQFNLHFGSDFPISQPVLFAVFARLSLCRIVYPPPPLLLLSPCSAGEMTRYFYNTQSCCHN